MRLRTSTYDKMPCIAVPRTANACVIGWDAIAARLRDAVKSRYPGPAGRCVVAVECYPGVDEGLVREILRQRLDPMLTMKTEDALRSADEIDALVAPFLGGDDPVFGFMNGLQLPQFFDPDRLDHWRARVEQTRSGLVLIVGCGATLLAQADILVYADLARWEAQNRFRRNASSNLGVDNQTLPASRQYKRAFFVDWRCRTQSSPSHTNSQFPDTSFHSRWSDVDSPGTGTAEILTGSKPNAPVVGGRTRTP
jgi:hypothetical protein